MSAQRRIVLLVEDNPGDAHLIKETLEESEAQPELHVAVDGTEAFAYLEGKPPYGVAKRPDILLLDLNLPKMDGRQVLQVLKRDVRFRTIPIVVLTTSDAAEDVVRSYEYGANCYVTKPVGFAEFRATLLSIVDFWLMTVKLP